MIHTIIVTDGEQRATLALVRAFGRRGHRVVVCAGRRHSLAGASRYATAHALVPDPLDSPEDFTASVERVAAEYGADSLIPVTDAALLALLPRRERLRGLAFPFADFERFCQISDKVRLLHAAAEAGIAVPTQQVLTSREEAGALIPGESHFPLVIKPARSVVAAGGGATKVSVSHASNLSELKQQLAKYPAAAYPMLLQQRIMGPGIGIFLLPWDGEAYAVFAHRRIREKPPSGGVSVYRESILPPVGLVEKSRSLLAQFGWKGVAMVEYKLDESTDTPHLMEINGRFWGSLQLALDAGVDFPNLLLALAHKEGPAPVSHYRIGVRSRWWWGDVDQLLARWRRSDRELAMPPGAPTRLGALLDFLRLWRPGDRNEVLRWDDPMPFARETFDWARGR